MTRLEQLQMKMREQQSRKGLKSVKTPKPVNVKIAKPKLVTKSVAPVAPAPQELDISPLDQMTLIDDVVNKMTREEITNQVNVVRLLNLFAFDELIRYKKRDFFKHVSDSTLDTVIELQRATNPKTARILCWSIVDSFENSLLNDEEATGSSGRRLRALEAAIEARSMQKQEAR